MQDEGETRESFAWRVRLVDSEPKKLYGILVAAVVATVFGWVILRSPVLGLLGFAIILGSTAEFWLGSSYEIDHKGVRSRTGLSLTSIEWEQVKRIINEGNAIRVSPLEKAGSLDPFRGVLLRFAADQRSQVEEALASFGRLRGGALDGSYGRGDGSDAG